jgi:hypothetical protein
MSSPVSDDPHPEAAPRRTPLFDVRPIGDELYSLRLWGPLPSGWSGHLTLGLARAAIGIERGHARRSEGSWEAEFHMRPARRNRETPTDPATIDYARLLARRAPVTPVAIELTDYRIHPLLGTIALEVEGVDSMGFLGSLLGRLAFLSLFPEEMNIETKGTLVTDSFRLRSFAGRPPSPEAPRALERTLHEIVRRSRIGSPV